MSDCGCGIPENAVILCQLHLVEYMDPDDLEIYKIDLSCDGDGSSDLPTNKYIELAEWARLMGTSNILASMVNEHLDDDDDDDGVPAWIL